MARKKRRSKQFKDSSKVIDMEQARKERQERLEKRRKARPPREQTYKKEVGESPPTSARQSRRRTMLRRRKQGRKLLTIAVCAGLIILMSFSVGHILVLKHDLHQAQNQQEEYLEEKKQMEKDMEQIDDLDRLEEQARDQMRLIMPGETLYIFPEDMSP